MTIWAMMNCELGRIVLSWVWHDSFMIPVAAFRRARLGMVEYARRFSIVFYVQYWRGLDTTKRRFQKLHPLLHSPFTYFLSTRSHSFFWASRPFALFLEETIIIAADPKRVLSRTVPVQR